MKMRLQKLLSSAGICSRREAETYILQGRVTVNAQTAELGQSADPETDTVCLDGEPVKPAAKLVYIMLNKPRDYVCTLRDEKGRRNVTELVRLPGVRLYPVGRLDMNSEGLLILTNDGEVTNKLTHPSHRVLKTYEVKAALRGADLNASLRLLSSDMEIHGGSIRAHSVSLLARERDAATLEIGIYEGRNRQIRLMCEQAGLSVKNLRRVREGELELGDLPTGKWRYLTGDELRYIRGI